MIFALAALAAASVHPAGITYLGCTSDRPDINFLITVNEPAGVVSYHNLTGWHEEAAQFSADAVYFMDLKLSRVDLSLSSGGAKMKQCHVIRKAKQAF